MTIEEIKDEVAIEYGWKSWKSCYGDDGITNVMIDEIAHRYAQSQTQELTDWKESMMKVHSELDLQGIGKSLGLPLGASIAPQVFPKVKELIEQNSELISMLEKCQSLMKNSIFTPHHNTALAITELLSKHNHLKSNTNVETHTQDGGQEG